MDTPPPRLPSKTEELGSVGLNGLKLTLYLCYANFVAFALLYVTGMYANIFITSGVSTISINDPINILHMLTATIVFTITFGVMMVGFMYGLRKVAIFSLGSVISMIIGTLGGLLFLSTGGSRASGSLTLIGGWIMAALFMLALFLSYYATLKVMRALKVVQAFS
jgi:hypothetical protein